ncbi:MAG: hypothetical protein ABID64_00565 [Nitrospirota bacterium]
MKKIISIAIFPAILASLVLFTACGSKIGDVIDDGDMIDDEDVSVVVDNDFFRLEAPGEWTEGETPLGVINIFYSDVESGDSRANLMNFKDSFSIVLDSKTNLGEDYIAGIKETLLPVLPGATYSNDECFVQVGEYDACSFEIDILQNEINLKLLMVAIEGAGSDVWLITYTTTETDYDVASAILDDILDNFELKSVE